MNRIVTLLIAVAATLLALPAEAAATRATLLLSAQTAKPGDMIMAAVRLEMSPGWHTYWKNGGDSGGPTTVKWQLPTGVTVGEMQWPTPEKYAAEDLVTYVYHDEAVLLVPLKLESQLPAGELELKAEVSWLECEKLCVPGEQVVTAKLVIGPQPESSEAAALIDAAKAKLPADGATLKPQASWEQSVSADERRLILEWTGATDLSALEFFPEASDGFSIGTTSETLSSAGQTKLRLTVKKFSGDWPKEFRGVLIGKRGATAQAFALTAPIRSEGTTSAIGKPASPASSGLLLNLGLAVLGGMILNLMPCVLPILSLKILAVVNQRGQPAAVARKHSLSYALGVLVSFWVIAGLVVLGRLATWGEQFQDARFIVLVTALMTLVALNLFGVFEFILPGRATGAAAELSAKEGAGGAFFNGILAVVLGASCVAPVLAGAIGWAVSQPPVVIVLTFTCIGLGLALPYVALTFFPALQKFLPRPGAWMEKFKVAMGFPMLATAAWLFSLLPTHYGPSGVLWVGLFLVLLAASAWVFGAFIQRGGGKPLAYLIAFGCLGFGYGFALEHKLNWRQPDYAAAANTGGRAVQRNGIEWQPWSAEAVAAAQASGRPILVDFTADWCLTCQANKASSLEIESVRQKLKAINAVALLGDYTKKSPAIRDELKRFERAGVPLVLVYAKNSKTPPEILPALLTPGIVLDALDRAAK